MTIYEMYDKNIIALPVTERLRLARLILDDAAPDEPMVTEQAQERYAQLIDEAYASGPATPVTKQDFEVIRQAIRVVHGARDLDAILNSPADEDDTAG